MRVSMCAIAAAAVGFAACAEGSQNAGHSPEDAGEDCQLDVATGPLKIGAGSWHLFVPDHANNFMGVPFFRDTVVKGCDQLVSLAHDIGAGGKAQISGDSQVLVSARGEDWKRNAINAPNGGSFRDLAQAGDHWVLVGQGGKSAGAILIADAVDASEWREVFQNEQWAFTSVAYGKGVHVAAANNGVAVSRDGVQWHWATVPAARSLYSEVAYGAGRFVVAGVGATITSTDGETWQEMACKDPSACVGPTPPPTSACPPGAICTQLSPPAAPAASVLALQQVTFADGKFYAYGASGKLVSSDGLTFEPIGGDRLPDAAIGGLLMNLTGQVRGAQVDMSMLSLSDDGARSWHGVPLLVEEHGFDCSKLACAAIPQGVIAFEP